MITPLGSRYGILSPLGRSVRRAAAGGWWLSGGIAAANCIAAYQPKGAADYAASKTNLANPGTYDAADGAAYPTWDDTNGWKFAAASSQYLDTGVIPLTNQTWSAAIRFTNNSTNYGYVFGTANSSGGTGFGISPTNYFTKRLYNNGSYVGLGITGQKAAGVMGFAGSKAFLDGTAETGTIPAVYSATVKSIYIGAKRNTNADSISNYATAYIQAAVFWNTVISDDQMIAVMTAMAAL